MQGDATVLLDAQVHDPGGEETEQEKRNREDFARLVASNMEYIYDEIKDIQDNTEAMEKAYKIINKVYFATLMATELLIIQSRSPPTGDSESSPNHSAVLSSPEHDLVMNTRRVSMKATEEMLSEIRKLTHQFTQESLGVDYVRTIKKLYQEKLKPKEKRRNSENIDNLKLQNCKIKAKMKEIENKCQTNESKIDEKYFIAMVENPANYLFLKQSSVATYRTPTNTDDESINSKSITFIIENSLQDTQSEKKSSDEIKLEAFDFDKLVTTVSQEIIHYLSKFDEDVALEIKKNVSNSEKGGTIDDQSYRNFEYLLESFESVADFKGTIVGDETQRDFLRYFLKISKVLLKKSKDIKQSIDNTASSMMGKSYLATYIKDKVKFDHFTKGLFKFSRSTRRMLTEVTQTAGSREYHFAATCLALKSMENKGLLISHVKIPKYDYEGLEWAIELNRVILHLMTENFIEISTKLILKYEVQISNQETNLTTSDETLKKWIPSSIQNLEKLMNETTEIILDDFELKWIAEKSKTQKIEIKQFEMVSNLQGLYISYLDFNKIILKLTHIFECLRFLHRQLNLVLDTSDESIEEQFIVLTNVWNYVVTFIEEIYSDFEAICLKNQVFSFGTKEETVSDGGHGLLEAQNKKTMNMIKKTKV